MESAASGRARGRFVALVGVGIVLHVLATAWWLWQGGFFDRPPAADAALYRLHAATFLHEGRDGGVLGIIGAGLRYRHWHPPLFPIAVALVNHALGTEPEGVTLWIPVAAFWALFIVGAARLVTYFLDGRERLVAMALILCAPGVIVYMRPAFSQMPMAALGLMAVGHLLRSAWLTRWPHAVAAGAYGGLALLTKEIVGIEVGACGLAFLLFAIARSPRPWWKTLLRALALVGAPAAAICGPWYAAHAGTIVEYARFVMDAEGQVTWSRGVPLASFERWANYPVALARFTLGMPITLVLLACLLCAMLRRTRRGATAAFPRREYACLLAGTACAYLALTVGITFDDAFYIIQWVPVVVIGAVAFAARAQVAHATRVAALGLMGIACAASLVAAYWAWQDPGPVARVGGFPLLDAPDRWFAGAARVNGARSRPDVERWPVEELVRTTAAWAGDRPGFVAGVYRPDAVPAYMYSVNLAFEAMKQGVDVRVIDPPATVTANPDEGVALLRAADVLCVDHALYSRGAIEALARAADVEVVELRDVTVNADWRFMVIGVRRSGDAAASRRR